MADCFVVSQVFSVARHAGRLKLGSKPTQLFVRLCILPLGQQTTHVISGIITHMLWLLLVFVYVLSDMRVLCSLEELGITQVDAVNMMTSCMLFMKSFTNEI